MFKIVTNDKAKSLRKKFICKFVNTETECYTQIRNIDTEAVVENQTYFYLRDTLTYEKRYVVSYEDALGWLRKEKRKVYVMWDISSRFKVGYENEDEKLLIKHQYQCDTVLEMSSADASKMIEEANDESKNITYSDRILPEDVYVFDEDVSFYFAFTHSFLRWEGNMLKDRIVYSSIDIINVIKE